MVYECDQCGATLPASVTACPKCGDEFDEPVPLDAEVKRGFTAVPAPPFPAVPPMTTPTTMETSSRKGYDWLDPPASVVRPTDGGSAGLRVIGCLLILGGLALAGYYFLAFDVSVAAPKATIFGNTIGGERVNNLGLMSDRQNGIIIGMSGAILGAILMYAGRKK